MRIVTMVRGVRQPASKPDTNAPAQSAPAPASTSTPLLPILANHLPIRPAANGPIVTHFQPSTRPPQSVTYEEFITDENCVDRESVRRKFGWGSLGKVHHIPYIYRNGENYCAARMVNKYIFDNFLSKMSDSIYFGCTNILGYYATIPESLLLNEINEFHCDNYYGPMPFKQNDVLVKLEEANNLYDFLTVCSNKLFNTPCDENKCGFLTINEKSIVPYVIMKDEKYVPLFYFDGMEGIKFKVQSVKNWNLSYLRFAFKVHGIRDEFCKSDDCSVIALDELTRYLEPGDTFKEWWPSVAATNKSVFPPNTTNKYVPKPWHQHPITVLPVSIVKYIKVPPNKNVAPPNITVNNTNMYYRTISH